MAVEYKKCVNCKGTGFIQPVPRAKGLKKCPICNGRGKKPIFNPNKKGVK